MTLKLKNISVGTESINHKLDYIRFKKYWKDIIRKSMPQRGRKCILLYIYPTKESYPDRDLLQISKMKGNPEEKKKR